MKVLQFLLSDNFDTMFENTANNVSTFSTIMFVLSGIVTVAIVVFIICVVIKSTRKMKDITGGVMGEIKENIEDNSNPNITCEYCGSVNKKENSTCKQCGASLNHKK